MTSTKKNSKKNPFQTKIEEARELTENLRGVTLDITKLRNNKEKHFRAVIYNNGTRYSLGYYTDPFEAAKAYNKKAKSLFGSEKKAKKIGRWNAIV